MVRIESLFSVDLFERFSVYVFQTHAFLVKLSCIYEKIGEMSSLERGRGPLQYLIGKADMEHVNML